MTIAILAALVIGEVNHCAAGRLRNPHIEAHYRIATM